MSKLLAEFDFPGFWKDSDYSRQTYVGEAVTPEQIVAIENELGHKLPGAYVDLIEHQNGGIPLKNCHRTEEANSWSDDHIAVAGIYGIDRNKSCSLCGECGHQFWIDEWGYPAIGLYFADCPSAGHDMLCLDYRQCGSRGEPQVVHVDQESDYKITLVANTFEEFVHGLESESVFAINGDAELGKDRAVSAWIDPGFAEEMGIEAPEDGWLKKEVREEDDER